MLEEKHLRLVASLVVLFDGRVVESFNTRSLNNSFTRAEQYTHPNTYLVAYLSPKSSPLEDEPWKKNNSYWDMLQEASKDAETFEKFIEQSTMKTKSGKLHHDVKKSETSYGDESKPERKGKYVPIEEWDAQQSDKMTAEEKLQWECQRSGNQLRQNDILMHHLNSF